MRQLSDKTFDKTHNLRSNTDRGALKQTDTGQQYSIRCNAITVFLSSILCRNSILDYLEAREKQARNLAA